MFKSNLLIIFRSFSRQKTTLCINLIGLSTGMTLSMMIGLWIIDELNIDRFHKNGNRIFQVLGNKQLTHGVQTDKSTTGMLEETLPNEIPEIEMAVAIIPLYQYRQTTISYKEINIKTGGQYAGKNYFSIFSFPLIEGNPIDVLKEKHNIVISHKLALQLFNTTQNIVGKTVSFQHEKKYTISGVFENIPDNSSVHFDFVLNFDAFKEENTWIMQWDNSSPYTYVLLKEGTNVTELNKKISNFLKLKSNSANTSLALANFPELYLNNRYENGVQSGGRIEYVRLFTIIGIFILIIACINFTNLSTAKASQKFKDIGIRKTLGAGKRTLILHYLSESLIVAFISLVLSILLIILLLPQFNKIMDKHLTINLNHVQVCFFVAFTVATGLLAGSYPAIYLSSLSPINALKNRLSNIGAELVARKGLVIFQFILSAVFISSVLVIYNQLKYIQEKNIGFDRNNILCIEAEGNLNGISGNLSPFFEEVKKIPGVISASSAGQHFIGEYASTTGIDWDGKQPNEQVKFESITVNYHFLEMIGVKLKEGRYFSETRIADSPKLILNDAAINIMGIKNAVGTKINMWGDVKEILAVTENFHTESFRETIKPTIIRLVPQDASVIYIKLANNNWESAITSIKDIYKKFNPGFQFDYHFLDEEFQQQYIAEKRISVLSKYFAGIAILISCLGLFGLSIYTVEKRRKEISIRKVLGSGSGNIILLLSSEFISIIITAILIATPISYLITQNWLQGFSFRTKLEPWFFILSGLLTLIISILTIMIESTKAAVTNPVKSLKEN